MSPRLPADEFNRQYRRLLREQQEAYERYAKLLPSVEMEEGKEPPSLILTLEWLQQVSKAQREHAVAQKRLAKFLEEMTRD
jgi:hypothetical protein